MDVRRHTTPNFMRWIFYELISYSIVSWLVFALVAFSSARFFRAWCIPVGHLVVLAIVFYLDVRWIQVDGEGRDMDAVFLFGIFLHAFMINTALLPVTAFGIWRRRRSLSHANVA